MSISYKRGKNDSVCPQSLNSDSKPPLPIKEPTGTAYLCCQYTHHLQGDASCHTPSGAEGCWEVEQSCTQAGIDNNEDGSKCRSGASVWISRRRLPLTLGGHVHTGTLQQAGPLPSISAGAPLAVVTVNADLGHGPRLLFFRKLWVLLHDHIPGVAERVIARFGLLLWGALVDLGKTKKGRHYVYPETVTLGHKEMTQLSQSTWPGSAQVAGSHQLHGMNSFLMAKMQVLLCALCSVH